MGAEEHITRAGILVASGLHIFMGGSILLMGSLFTLDANIILQHPKMIKLCDALALENTPALAHNETLGFRLLGPAVATLGYYYIRAGIERNILFIQATLSGRVAYALAILTLVGIRKLPSWTIVVALYEVLGATASYFTLPQNAVKDVKNSHKKDL
ncbi:hypothetical protein SeLEV6574_g05451 [Synchytrium endobioticum]|nr:hypothetical protein SeLEV6574_g05451 [Synchytrium endobioticum]